MLMDQNVWTMLTKKWTFTNTYLHTFLTISCHVVGRGSGQVVDNWFLLTLSTIIMTLIQLLRVYINHTLIRLVFPWLEMSCQSLWSFLSPFLLLLVTHTFLRCSCCMQLACYNVVQNVLQSSEGRIDCPCLLGGGDGSCGCLKYLKAKGVASGDEKLKGEAHTFLSLFCLNKSLQGLIANSQTNSSSTQQCLMCLNCNTIYVRGEKWMFDLMSVWDFYMIYNFLQAWVKS